MAEKHPSRVEIEAETARIKTAIEDINNNASYEAYHMEMDRPLSDGPPSQHPAWESELWWESQRLREMGEISNKHDPWELEPGEPDREAWRIREWHGTYTPEPVYREGEQEPEQIWGDYSKTARIPTPERVPMSPMSNERSSLSQEEIRGQVDASIEQLAMRREEILKDADQSIAQRYAQGVSWDKPTAHSYER